MRLATYRDPGGVTAVGELEDDRLHRLEAATMLDWLAGSGRERTGTVDDLAAVVLLAPVPEPPSVRDFFAFERHVAAGWRRRGADVPAYWYEAPAFYFTNPAAIYGPDEPIGRPPECARLDFELEIAAVIGAGGELAGFTLMNDWSARDVQVGEMTVGLGPHKSKDFATSLGPLLVTPDELPYRDGRLHVTATVTVNGEQITSSDASEQQFGWPELLAQAGRNTRLRPGDVLGSGTLNGGCLLELGPLPGERWIEPGDVVTLAADGLGQLSTPVV